MRVPFRIKDLFHIEPGSKVTVYWCKDNDSRDCRLNYEDLEVIGVESNGTLYCEEGWEFNLLAADDHYDNKVNMAGRGTAEFFHSLQGEKEQYCMGYLLGDF